MIAVAILGFGLIIAIGSYSASARALNSSQNYIEASNFAKQKMEELEQLEYESGDFDLPEKTDSGKINLNNREFNWISAVKGIQEPDYLAEKAVLAYVKLAWKEQNIDKGLTVATYLPKKEEAKPEEKQVGTLDSRGF